MNDISVKNRLETSIPLNVQGNSEALAQGGSFGDILTGAMGETARLQHEANSAISALASGRDTDIHQTMIAMEKASISFKLLMQVRNKVITAYQEIMRTQV